MPPLLSPFQEMTKTGNNIEIRKPPLNFFEARFLNSIYGYLLDFLKKSHINKLRSQS